MNIIEGYQEVLMRLLQIRETHPEFTFWVRKKGDGLNKGYWFQGTDRYISVGLVKDGSGNLSTKSVALHFEFEKGIPRGTIILENRLYDKSKYFAFYQELSTFLKPTKKDHTWYLSLDNSKGIDSIIDAFWKFYPTIISVIKKYHLEKELLVDNESFEKSLKKIIAYMNKEHRSTQNQSDKIIPLNQILYGPPGTGKTFNLQTEYFPKFISQHEQLTEMDFKIRVRKYTWWQVVAAALYNYEKGTTVPELVKSRLIKAKHQPSADYQTPNHIVWSILKDNTELFIKKENSIWEVNKEILIERFPTVQEIHALLAENALTTISLNQEEKENYKFVTFHQSFSYEDFIEGIKPILTSEPNENSELRYEVRSGLFYDLCLKGINMAGYDSFLDCYKDTPESRKKKFNDIKGNSDKQVAIFIDEINRGNVSAIFGELITLIEADKRIGTENEIWVELPYSKDKFGVPPNLYIIGTMNTADRSVEALDTALRRRFSFTEMSPKPELLSPSAMFTRLFYKYAKQDWEDKEYLKKESELASLLGINTQSDLWKKRINTWEKEMYKKDQSDLNRLHYFNDAAQLNFEKFLNNINKRIEVLLDSDHAIGHSYFMKIDNIEDFKSSIYNNVIPLLQEYFYGDYAKIGAVLGKGFIREKQIVNPKEEAIFAEFDGFDNGDYSEKTVYEIVDYRSKNLNYEIDSEKTKVSMTFEKAIRLLMNQKITDQVES